MTRQQETSKELDQMSGLLRVRATILWPQYRNSVRLGGC